MYLICSFLRAVCRLVKNMFIPRVNMTKHFYRSSAVIMAGTAVVAVMTFSSTGLAAGGHNALTVYADTSADGDTLAEMPEETEEEEAGEAQLLQTAKIQRQLTGLAHLKNGQLLVGETIVRNVQEQEAVRLEQKKNVEVTEQRIAEVEEERRKRAEEEAARKAEEERRHAAAEAVRANAVISFSDQDYEVLKRIVEAEAGGCDMKGRILVADVVINRVRNKEYPSTITDVVYQKSQFSPVGDGRINSCAVSDKTVEAVNRALGGEDYSQGALFFMNRGRSGAGNVSWFDGHLTYLFQYEKHEFFR